MNFSRDKSLLMVDLEMSINTEHQYIITSKLIGIYNASSSDGFNLHAQKIFCSEITQDFNFNNAISFKYTEYRDLVAGTPSSFPFSLAAKIVFISFYCSIKKNVFINAVSNKTLPDQINSFQGAGIGNLHLTGYLTSRDTNPKSIIIHNHSAAERFILPSQRSVKRPKLNLHPAHR